MSKKKSNWTKVPNDVKESARILYMNYTPISEIASRVDVNENTLKYYIAKEWRSERELVETDLMQAVSDAKRKQLTSIMADSLKIMERSLKELANRAEAPTTKEALDAAKILTAMAEITKASTSGKDEALMSGFNENMNKEALEEPKEIKNIDPFGGNK